MNTATSPPRIGWASNPQGRGPAGMAHATYSGQTTALCGIKTPYLGEEWPSADEEWPSRHGRCPVCAHRLYSGRRP